jgi:hypothetical protein
MELLMKFKLVNDVKSSEQYLAHSEYHRGTFYEYQL